MFCDAISSKPKLNTLFDHKTGIISADFQKLLEIVNIVSEKHFQEYESNHVCNVLYALESAGCFKRNVEYYKEGGPLPFEITDEQAIRYLNKDYKKREVTMPRQKNIESGLFQCGVEFTLHKNFQSLRVSLEQKYTYNVIHFIAANETIKKNVETLIDSHYKSMLSEIKVEIIVANMELNFFETALKMLLESSLLGSNYALICDPLFKVKVEGISQSILIDQECLGVVCVPIKDWRDEMENYGYKDPIRFVFSSLNFKTREANDCYIAFQAYTVTKLNKQKKELL